MKMQICLACGFSRASHPRAFETKSFGTLRCEGDFSAPADDTLDELVEAAIDAHNALLSLLRGEAEPSPTGPGSLEAINLAETLAQFGAMTCEKCGFVGFIDLDAADTKCFACEMIALEASGEELPIR